MGHMAHKTHQEAAKALMSVKLEKPSESRRARQHQRRNKLPDNAPRESVENDRDHKGPKGLAITRHKPDKRDKAASV